MEIERVKTEIYEWFFETYFNHWVDVGAGKRNEGPEFILEYWGTPMFATVDEPEIATWMMTGEEIVGFLALQHNLLKAGGYSHTHVPDKKVHVYNQNGGAIEVIWSRRAADESEIQRFVAHFEVIKINNKWKVVGIQTRRTTPADNDSITKAWQN